MAEDTMTTETVDSAQERLEKQSVREVAANDLKANLSAIGTATTTSLEANASAVALARVEGESTASMSAVALTYAKGDASMRQSYASAFVAAGEMSLSQSAAAASVARTISFEQSGSVATVASNITAQRSFIGILLAGRSEISDDSRILITGRALIVLAIVMLGGFGLVAVALAYAGRQLSTWRPSISLPHWRR